MKDLTVTKKNTETVHHEECLLYFKLLDYLAVDKH